MASLTIGGQVREIRFTTADLDQAERQMIKNGGRAILDVLGNHGGAFSKYELEWLLWGAWRRQLTGERFQKTVTQFYADGGTLYDLQSEVIEALIDSGLYGKRPEPTDTAPDAAGNGQPVDPPLAGTSV